MNTKLDLRPLPIKKAEAVINGLFNILRVEAKMSLSKEYKNMDFRYDIYLCQAPAKDKLIEAQAFAKGVAYATH